MGQVSPVVATTARLTPELWGLRRDAWVVKSAS